MSVKKIGGRDPGGVHFKRDGKKCGRWVRVAGWGPEDNGYWRCVKCDVRTQNPVIVNSSARYIGYDERYDERLDVVVTGRDIALMSTAELELEDQALMKTQEDDRLTGDSHTLVSARRAEIGREVAARLRSTTETNVVVRLVITRGSHVADVVSKPATAEVLALAERLLQALAFG